MTFSNNPKQIAIIEDNSGESEPKQDSIISSSNNLADVVTRKPPNIMKWCNRWSHVTLFSNPQGKLRPAEEVLQQAKGPTDDQSDEEDHHVPARYKDYKEKLDEE